MKYAVNYWKNKLKIKFRVVYNNNDFKKTFTKRVFKTYYVKYKYKEKIKNVIWFTYFWMN